MLAPYFVAVEGEGFAVLQAANKADALQLFLRLTERITHNFLFTVYSLRFTDDYIYRLFLSLPGYQL